MSLVATALASQFDRVWAMIREAVDNTPDDEWLKTGPSGDNLTRPARHAFHVVQSVDRYLGHSPKDPPTSSRLDIEWETCPVELLPTKEQVLNYLEEIEQRLRVRLNGLSEKELEAPSEFDWTGATVTEHWMYVLRHTQNHLSILNTTLHARNLKRAAWR